MFFIAIGDKHFSEFLPTRWQQKSTGIDMSPCAYCFFSLRTNRQTDRNRCFMLWAINATSIITRSSAIAEGPRDASCQLKSCQLPRNSAETTYTTSPDQIDGMKLEIAFIQSALRLHMADPCTKSEVSSVSRCSEILHGV